MAGRGWVKGKFLIGFVGLALLAAGVAWVERGPLLAWFYLQRLAAADESSRDAWVGRVAGLGDAAVPGLLGLLARPDPTACGNARAALERLVADWGAPEDPRTADLALHLAHEFSHQSPPGQQQTLTLAASWFPPGGTVPRSLLPPAARLLAEAATVEDGEVQAAALELCGRVLAQPENAEFLRPAQDLVCAGLRAASAANRLRAVRLALYPGMDLLKQVVPLLSDPEAEVRGAALLAVGPAPADVVPDECLLPSLHDADPEVRRLCEVALGGRGLRPDFLELGRLLTDPKPAMRLLVLDRLHHTPDLDLGLWLRRLSHDPSPAVRVAAMRAMTQQPYIDLSDRIDQMARSDPSPTVCQLARFYLNCPRPVRPRHEEMPRKGQDDKATR